ncbi:MAG: hypothetical protein JJU24_17120 [Natronohydrobacter sp.]|nr:hypothetical protein [Natronohydrobacter sp.]
MIGSLGLAACQEGATSSPTLVDRSAVSAAQSPAELRALGAEQMDAAQLRADWAGAVHDAGDWTFTINADGTWSAAAKDGSWADRPGTWQIADDRFCREGPDTARECQTLYRIGNYVRVVQEDGQTLRPWMVTLG